MEKEHIIILRFSAIGDVAMTVPVVYALSKQYPDAKITVVSRSFAQAFYQNLSHNIHFIGIDLKNEYKGIKGLNKIYNRLIAEKPTAIADFHNVLRTKYIRLRFKLAGYKTAYINKHKTGKKLLCRKNNKVFKQQPTSFQNYADVLHHLGYPINIEFDSIFSEKDILTDPFFNKIMPKNTHEKWIGIAPFAAHSGKMYPKEKMEDVIKILSSNDKTNIKIFLFGGGKSEMDTLNQWQNSYPNCQCAAHITQNLHEELLLMSQLDVMISMDSANMHLASLVGTRVVSIWGATHIYCGFLGWNQKEADVIQNKDLACRPCSVFGNKPCYRKDFACMHSINPKDIIDKILS